MTFAALTARVSNDWNEGTVVISAGNHSTSTAGQMTPKAARRLAIDLLEAAEHAEEQTHLQALGRK